MVSSIWTRRGSLTQAVRHLVRAVGGKRARETAEQVVEEKQKPREKQ